MATSKKGTGASGARRKLAEYRRKRDFTKTAEPSGEEASRKPASPVPLPPSRALAFVVQKHAASHLHFDFRLELGGVMKSWAVPKGPSLDPAVKRLAMEVEDHPIGYNKFEGTIPAGEYGGGTVMLWDRGTYEAADGGGEASLERGYAAGRLDFVMHGERLEGGFTLVRTRGSGGSRGSSGSKPQWLLVKRKDEAAEPGSDVVAREVTSVATGRTMEEIGGREGGRGKREGGRAKGASETTARAKSARGATRAAARADRAAARAGGPPPTSTSRQSAARAQSKSRAQDPASPFPLPTSRSSAAILARLDAIESTSGDGTLSLGRGTTLDVTSLDKVFFPADGYTKGDVMRYYARMAKYLLPVIADRPLVLRRFPNGIDGKAFYQHDVPDPPPGVRAAPVDVDGDGDFANHLVGGDLATVLYSVQLGAISVDPFHSRVGSLGDADYAILDLDPGPRAPFARVVEVAARVKEELDALGLRGALKTSGSTGIHVHVPLPKGTSNESALLVAQLVATRVAAALPKAATVERAVKARPATVVYVDYLQNILGKTVAAAYAVRAKPGATVSTPLAWEELGDDLDPRAFTIESVPARVAKVGDLWRAAMRRPNSAKALAALARPKTPTKSRRGAR